MKAIKTENCSNYLLAFVFWYFLVTYKLSSTGWTLSIVKLSLNFRGHSRPIFCFFFPEELCMKDIVQKTVAKLMKSRLHKVIHCIMGGWRKKSHHPVLYSQISICIFFLMIILYIHLLEICLYSYYSFNMLSKKK